MSDERARFENYEQALTAPRVKLLPCPFCGGEAYESRSVNGSYTRRVGCSECGVGMKDAFVPAGNPALFQWSAEIVESWNTRVGEKAAYAAGAADENERAAKRLEQEAMEYDRSSRACDASGNIIGGGHDAASSCALSAMARAIRSRQGQGKVKP